MNFSNTSAIYQSITSWFNSFSDKKSFSCSTSCCEKEPISNEQKGTTNLKIANQEYEILGCSLTEFKLAERKNELQKEVFFRVIKTKEIETGFAFSFPYEEKFLLKMTEYIISEKRCCPFFTFEIKLQQSGSILLQITGPLESKKMLELFLTDYNLKL